MQPVFLAALPNSINVYDYLFLFFFFSAWCWGKHHPFVKPLNFSCKGSAETRDTSKQKWKARGRRNNLTSITLTQRLRLFTE